MIPLYSRVPLALIGALLALVLVLPASAQESTILLGRVLNETQGGTVPKDLSVTLRILEANGNIRDRTAQVDENGEFRFEGVPVVQGTSYGVFTDYQNVRYTRQISAMPPVSPVELVIYEAGATAEAISFDSNIMIIGWADPQRRVLGVLESVSVINFSDRSFISNIGQPSSMNFLRFSLPPTYLNLDVQSNLAGGEAVPIDRGFGLTTPVPPGHYEVLFTYLIQYEGSGISFSRSFPFGAKTFSVLIPQGMGRLQIAGLQEKEPTSIGSTTFVRLEGQDILRDTRLEISIQELPQPNLMDRIRNTMGGGTAALIGIPFLLGLALAIILGYVVMLRRWGRRAVQDTSAFTLNREALVQSIANLDKHFEQGLIEQKEYEEKRALLKDMLLKQTQEEANP